MNDKQKINRLESENAVLKEIIKNLYKKTLEALNMANGGKMPDIKKPDQ
jgi:hypothetical protein